MYFATRDPGFKIQMQGVAAAPANTTFDRSEWTHLSQDGPLLKPELPWEGECIEAAAIIRRNGQLYMFYAGSHDNTPQQIGVATSQDGVKWTRWISNVEVFWNEKGPFLQPSDEQCELNLARLRHFSQGLCRARRCRAVAWALAAALPTRWPPRDPASEMDREDVRRPFRLA